MKKHNFQKIALSGLASGLLISSSLIAADTTTSSTTKTTTTTDKSSTSGPNIDKKAQEEAQAGNMNYHLYTEEELKLELNDEGLKAFNSLDSAGKELALEVASQRCNGMNKCKGLNACQTDSHTCAGKGSCKGTGKCAFSDKNLAVKLVAEKMAGKRANLNH